MASRCGSHSFESTPARNGPANRPATPGNLIQRCNRPAAITLRDIIAIILEYKMISRLKDCQQYVVGRCHASANWRDEQLIRFPYDKRNGEAAIRLRQLAGEIHITESEWEELSPFYDEYDARWLKAVSTTNRDIQFRKYPQDSAAYLQQLTANLTRQ